MNTLLVLSYVQARQLVTAWQKGISEPTISLDLNLTQSTVRCYDKGVALTATTFLDWSQLATIAADENSCFLIKAGQAEKIQRFSEETNRYYSLYPTTSAPTLLISGIAMHRIKESNPHQDTLAKVNTIKPITGRVLDTTTGLGYTAIQAVKSADHLITVELDPAVLEVARCNPWSQALFTTPTIEQRIGDSDDVIRTFADNSFDRILHDPPMFNLAGHLYGADFYRELYRVLDKRGRLFHYIANPDSKSGATITRGVMRRLEEVGFQRVTRRPEAFGVIAFK
ncbi:MAG: methyltransferase domain-containing protein [Caldilinea sp. CFX5]|nr:methyltransferase domain-containing protein [Caldilinea sp. CFX5]